MPFNSPLQYGTPSSVDYSTNGYVGTPTTYLNDSGMQPRFNDVYIHTPPFGTDDSNKIIWTPGALRRQTSGSGAVTKLSYMEFSFQESSLNPKTYAQLQSAGITMYYKVNGEGVGLNSVNSEFTQVRELQTSKTGWTGAGETHYFGLTIGQEFCVGLNMDKPLAGSTGVYNFYLVNRTSGHTGEIMWRIQYIVGVTYSQADSLAVFPPASIFGVTLPTKTYIHAGSVADADASPLENISIDSRTDENEPILLNFPTYGLLPSRITLLFIDGGNIYYGGSKRDNHFINYQYNLTDAVVTPVDTKPYQIESV